MAKHDDEEQELEMVPVVSSNLAAVGWLDGTLRVEFNSGTTWEYEDVPEDIFASIRDAASPGSYFAGNIRGQYNGRKIS